MSRAQRLGGLALVLLVGVGLWLFTRSRDAPVPSDAQPKRAAAPADARPTHAARPLTKPAPPSDPDALVTAKLDYRRKLDEIRKIRRELREEEAANRPKPAPPKDKEAVLRSLKREFLPLLLECSHGEVDSMIDESTNLVLEFHLIGEPDIGAVVDEVELVAGDQRQAGLTTCVTESLYAVHVDPPVESLEMTDTITLQVSLPGE